MMGTGALKRILAGIENVSNTELNEPIRYQNNRYGPVFSLKVIYFHRKRFQERYIWVEEL
jgi:hypothetical protein